MDRNNRTGYFKSPERYATSYEGKGRSLAPPGWSRRCKSLLSYISQKIFDKQMKLIQDEKKRFDRTKYKLKSLFTVNWK